MWSIKLLISSSILCHSLVTIDQCAFLHSVPIAVAGWFHSVDGNGMNDNLRQHEVWANRKSRSQLIGILNWINESSEFYSQPSYNQYTGWMCGFYTFFCDESRSVSCDLQNPRMVNDNNVIPILGHKPFCGCWFSIWYFYRIRKHSNSFLCQFITDAAADTLVVFIMPVCGGASCS